MRCVIVFVCLVVASCAHAENPPIAIEIDDASRDQAKNQIVLMTTRDGKSRLTRETNFQLSFDRDVDSAKNSPVYQTGKPVIRTTYTIADTGKGVQIVADLAVIENVGTVFEKRTSDLSDEDANAVRYILITVKNNLQTLSKKPDPKPEPKPEPKTVNAPRPHNEVAHQIALEPKAPQAPPAKKAAPTEPSTRLGFSAELSKDATHKGFVVIAVDPDTPAYSAGLQPSDIVTAIDGKPIATFQDMEAAQAKMKKTKRGKIKVIRDGKPYDATLKLQ